MSPSSQNEIALSTFESLRQFLEDLDSADTGDIGVDLLLARVEGTSSDHTSYDFKRIKIDDDIAPELETLVQEKVENKAEAHENDNIRFDSYSLENRDRDETLIQYEDVENIPKFQHFDRLLQGQRFRHTSYEEPPKPEFQAIRLRDENDEDMAIAFLNYRRSQILGRKSRIRMKFGGSDTHRKVDESILSIPDRVDAVYYDDTMFIFDQSKFEKIFDYLEEYRRRADDVIEHLEESEIPFQNFDLFKDAIYGNNKVLRLMYKVHQRGAYENMTLEDAEYVRENFDADIKFEENDEGDMEVKMDNKLDIFAVLRFFNDDHVDSPITDEQYVSLSKRDA
jgi:hypothetical protein